MSDRIADDQPHPGSPKSLEPRDLEAMPTLVASADDGGKPSLADSAALLRLFGEYVGGIAERWGQAGNGTLDRTQAVKITDAELDRLAGILAGKDATWHSAGQWTEKGMPAHLSKVLAEIVPNLVEKEGPVRALLGYVTLETYGACADMANGQTVDDLRERLEGIVEDATRLALGLPPDAAFEGGAVAEG